MQYLQIHFTQIPTKQSDILIAQLSNIGFDAFEEEENQLKACIEDNNFNEVAFNEIPSVDNFHYTKKIIEKENWNAKWESSFEPIEVFYEGTKNPFVFVRAGFHNPKEIFKYDIIITPKMSFGTGHHATTYLMMQQMGEIDFVNKSVIDFGTGTGVLAILAQKMEATKTIAIDCDDWSIENAIENANVNKAKNIDFIKASTISTNTKADIILANINLNIISENIVSIKNAANISAIILFSGIMLHDKEHIIKLLTSHHFVILGIIEKDNWLALKCTFN